MLDVEEKSTFITFLQTVDIQTEDEKRSMIDNYIIAPLFKKKHIDAFQVYVAIPSFGTTSTVYTKFIDVGGCICDFCPAPDPSPDIGD